MKKITVLTGNYGSGKTEIALNTALKLRENNEKVTLVDFDTVNPYFRSSEHRQMLEQKGIRVIAPEYAGTGVDLPLVPPEVLSAFKGGYSVFDVGGDSAGASALGSLYERISRSRSNTEVLFVVNTKRPFQDSALRIKESLTRVKSVSRLMADGFILNSNLGPQTTGEMLAYGLDIINEASRLTGVPVKAVSGTKKTLDRFKEIRPDYAGHTIEIKIFMRPSWMELD